MDLCYDYGSFAKELGAPIYQGIQSIYCPETLPKINYEWAVVKEGNRSHSLFDPALAVEKKMVTMGAESDAALVAVIGKYPKQYIQKVFELEAIEAAGEKVVKRQIKGHNVFLFKGKILFEDEDGLVSYSPPKTLIEAFFETNGVMHAFDYDQEKKRLVAHFSDEKYVIDITEEKAWIEPFNPVHHKINREFDFVVNGISKAFKPCTWEVQSHSGWDGFGGRLHSYIAVNEFGDRIPLGGDTGLVERKKYCISPSPQTSK